MENQIAKKWDNLSQEQKTKIGITIDDRFNIINSPINPLLSHWNKDYINLSELKKQRLSFYFK